MKKTTQEIAQSWQLWCDHVDPRGVLPKEHFDSLTVEERVEFIHSCFGSDEMDEEEGFKSMV